MENNEKKKTTGKITNFLVTKHNNKSNFIQLAMYDLWQDTSMYTNHVIYCRQTSKATFCICTQWSTQWSTRVSVMYIWSSESVHEALCGRPCTLKISVTISHSHNTKSAPVRMRWRSVATYICIICL